MLRIILRCQGLGLYMSLMSQQCCTNIVSVYWRRKQPVIPTEKHRSDLVTVTDEHNDTSLCRKHLAISQNRTHNFVGDTL